MVYGKLNNIIKKKSYFMFLNLKYVKILYIESIPYVTGRQDNESVIEISTWSKLSNGSERCCAELYFKGIRDKKNLENRFF